MYKLTSLNCLFNFVENNKIMKILFGILVIILLSVLLKSCDPNPAEYSHAWGCTKYITIKYSDGRDTSYTDIFVLSADGSQDEVTKVETLQDGIIKTTIESVSCVHIQSSP